MVFKAAGPSSLNNDIILARPAPFPDGRALVPENSMNEVIYSYVIEGTDLPEFDCFKIYKDGTVVWTCGNIYDKQNRRKYTAKLSEQSIKKIKKLIEDNPKVFTIKEIQDRYYCATDVAYSSFYFSDGQKKNKIKVYDLEQFEDLPEECPKFSEDVRNARLLITIRKKIEKLYFKAFDKATVSPEDIYRNSF